ncbi:MAG: hypothetical protein D3910_03755 [Candidatus Electrothrix sp. ATG2]|nr:hypothetical protein [Candidatus Electrothrix sp. ATG2]
MNETKANNSPNGKKHPLQEENPSLQREKEVPEQAKLILHPLSFGKSSLQPNTGERYARDVPKQFDRGSLSFPTGFYV